MSYRGRPSKGCQLCRSRKVKCDEAKPTCSRCEKSGHECQYRDQSDLLFRNQTAIAAQKAEDGWRKRATKPSSSKSSQSPPSFDPVSNLTTVAQNLSLSRQPSQDLHDLAYNRFLYDFVIPSAHRDDTSGLSSDGVLDFKSMYDDAAPHSCLKAAHMAVCYANYGGRFKSAEATMLSSEFCGKALKLVQAAIRDAEQAKSDETLLAVYLLGIWENLTADTFNGHWIAHKRGALGLLKLRKPEEIYTPIGARLFQLVYTQVLIANFGACEEPPEFLDQWSDVIHGLTPAATKMRLTKIIHRAVSIWSKWRRYIAMPDVTITEPVDPMELLSAANDLDVQFQTWENENLPDDWSFQVLQNKPSIHSSYDPYWVELILKSEGAPPQVHVYSNLRVIFGWNLYRAARLLLNKAMLEMVETSVYSPSPAAANSPPTDPMLLDATRIDYQISRLAEDICASILSHFTVLIPTKPDSNSASNVCGIRGYFVLWPLAILAQILRNNTVVGVDSVKRLGWVRNIMLFLQHQLGLAKAGAVIRATSFEIGASQSEVARFI